MNRASIERPPIPDRSPPFGSVVFDCDSTLSAMEGIEELAQGSVALEITRLTNAAMAGEVPLEEVFGRRLEWIRPSRADLERVGRAYIEKALPNVRVLVQALLELGKRVIIVSGGLRPAVDLFARHLGIEEVHAVGVQFTPDGSYRGFDSTSPLARAGGKIEVLAELTRDAPPKGLVLIGDGATDLEAAHLAERFIAFGGVVRRDAVFDAARVSTTSADYRELLPLLLDAEECRSLRSLGRFPSLFPGTASH